MTSSRVCVRERERANGEGPHSAHPTPFHSHSILGKCLWISSFHAPTAFPNRSGTNHANSKCMAFFSSLRWIEIGLKLHWSTEHKWNVQNKSKYASNLLGFANVASMSVCLLRFNFPLENRLQTPNGSINMQSNQCIFNLLTCMSTF